MGRKPKKPDPLDAMNASIFPLGYYAQRWGLDRATHKYIYHFFKIGPDEMQDKEIGTALGMDGAWDFERKLRPKR